MVCTIQSSRAKGKVHYLNNRNLNLKGEANYTLGVLPNDIKVYDEANGAVYRLIQPHLLPTLILGTVPLAGLLVRSRYRYYENERLSGESIDGDFKIRDNVYEIQLHSYYYVSIMENDVQIALVHEDCSEWGNRKIEVRYSPSVESNFNLFFLLCIYIDRIFFTHRGGVNDSCKVIGDKYKERAKWRPDNNVN